MQMPDPERIEKYLIQIAEESDDIAELLKRSDEEITPHLIKSCKYSLIVISEAIANTLQHILAKKFNSVVTGYTEVFLKARQHKILSQELISRLKPFISFRNMLVHQYWRVNDEVFLDNLRKGIGDFKIFIKEIRNFEL